MKKNVVLPYKLVEDLLNEVVCVYLFAEGGYGKYDENIEAAEDYAKIIVGDMIHQLGEEKNIQFYVSNLDDDDDNDEVDLEVEEKSVFLN